jgi:hypothetical protein
MEKRELLLGTDGSVLVLSALTGSQIMLPSEVESITALAPHGVIPALLKPQIVKVLLRNGSIFEGKYVGRDLHYVILDIEGRRRTMCDYTDIDCPLEGVWELDEYKDVTVRAALLGMTWFPHYTMMVENKKVKH